MRAKIKVLATTDGELPPKMLTPTKEPHVKELRVNSKEALRLLVCRGPLKGRDQTEYTLLYGAIEKDSKYVPKNALTLAETNRLLVIADPINRRRLRKDEDPEETEE